MAPVVGMSEVCRIMSLEAPPCRDCSCWVEQRPRTVLVSARPSSCERGALSICSSAVTRTKGGGAKAPLHTHRHWAPTHASEPWGSSHKRSACVSLAAPPSSAPAGRACRGRPCCICNSMYYICYIMCYICYSMCCICFASKPYASCTLTHRTPLHPTRPGCLMPLYLQCHQSLLTLTLTLLHPKPWPSMAPDTW